MAQRRSKQTGAAAASRTSAAPSAANGPLLSPVVSSSPPTTRGRRTRSALVQAARETFEELGFRNARVSDIVQRAGTSQGNFYHYFDTKQDVLRELFTTMTGEMFVASKVPAETADDPYARIRATNEHFIAAISRNAHLIAVVEEMAIRDAYFRDLKLQIRDLFVHRNEHGIRRLQEQGLADPHIDPRIAASVLGGMIEHFCLLWFVHGVTFDETAALDNLTRLWAQAIGLKVPPDER